VGGASSMMPRNSMEYMPTNNFNEGENIEDDLFNKKKITRESIPCTLTFNWSIVSTYLNNFVGGHNFMINLVKTLEVLKILRIANALATPNNFAMENEVFR
jgi:hypothetical protein